MKTCFKFEYRTNTKTLKGDLHSANVSRATDAVEWRMAFFNLHLRRTKCSFCLIFLLTRSSHWNVLDKIVTCTCDQIPYTIQQGVHLLVKMQAGGTNEKATKMKSLTGISHGFDKCTKATLQNYFCRAPPYDCFCFETWAPKV